MSSPPSRTGTKCLLQKRCCRPSAQVFGCPGKMRGYLREILGCSTKRHGCSRYRFWCQGKCLLALSKTVGCSRKVLDSLGRCLQVHKDGWCPQGGACVFHQDVLGSPGRCLSDQGRTLGAAGICLCALRREVLVCPGNVLGLSRKMLLLTWEIRGCPRRCLSTAESSLSPPGRGLITTSVVAFPGQVLVCPVNMPGCSEIAECLRTILGCFREMYVSSGKMRCFSGNKLVVLGGQRWLCHPGVTVGSMKNFLQKSNGNESSVSLRPHPRRSLGAPEW